MPDSFTGAEQPRSSEGTGGAATSSKTKSCASLSSSSMRAAISVPSGARSPIATGIGSGRLSGWPGVGAVRWRRVSV